MPRAAQVEKKFDSPIEAAKYVMEKLKPSPRTITATRRNRNQSFHTGSRLADL
jgi:hypothetical protein